LSGGSVARQQLARSSADVDAVALVLGEAVLRADRDVVSARLTARNQRDAAVAAERLAGAVDGLFRTGRWLLEEDSDLHRHWRDVLTVASHGALGMEGAAGAFARSLFDEDPTVRGEEHARAEAAGVH
jgi:hypothetical protein